MPDMPKATPPSSISIGDVYYLLFRHKWKIVLGVLTGALAAITVYIVTPNVYESEAKLLVRYVTDTTVLDPVSTGERITAPGRGGENVINSEIEILSSQDLIEKVMDEMGVTRFSLGSARLPARARLVEATIAALNIEVPKNSNIIRIVFDGPAPAVSQEFLRRLTESYLQKHIEIHRAAGAYEFLSQQTDQLRSRLSETEEELRKLKFSEGIVSIDETKKNVAQRTEELTKGLGELESALASAKAKYDVLRPLLSGGGGEQPSLTRVEPVTDNTAQALKSRLSRLQQRETELLASYTVDSIPARSLRQQIMESQQLIDAQQAKCGAPLSIIPATNNVAAALRRADLLPSLLESQADVASIQAKIAVQTGLLSRAVASAQKINDIETRVVQLQRNKDLQESNYRYYCQSLEHARIDEALNAGKISNISIVQPATLPAETFRPKLLRKMGIALMLGVFFGLGLALAQEYFIDHTIRHPAEMQTILQVPLLMSLPLMSRRQLARQGRSERDGSRLLGPLGSQSVAAVSVLSVEQNDQKDLYDALRERLLARLGVLPADTPYVLGVTSCVEGSGVSTIAAGLALSLARNGDQRVVLMDANAESGMPTLFGVNPGTGLVEMMPDGDGNTAVTQHNAYLVPSGGGAPRPTNNSSAHRFAALIQWARNSKASFIIVDMPPVTETGLTLRIGRLFNGVCLVIAAEKVNRHMAEYAKTLLQQSEVTLVGSILNKRRQYVPDWLYPTC